MNGFNPLLGDQRRWTSRADWSELPKTCELDMHDKLCEAVAASGCTALQKLFLFNEHLLYFRSWFIWLNLMPNIESKQLEKEQAPKLGGKAVWWCWLLNTRSLHTVSCCSHSKLVNIRFEAWSLLVPEWRHSQI